MDLELVFHWVMASSIMASILAGFILLLRYAWQDRLDARWQYALWILLIVKLLMPYSIQSPWRISHLLPDNTIQTAEAMQANIHLAEDYLFAGQSENNGLAVKDTASTQPPDADSADKPNSDLSFYIRILAIIWLTGAIMIAVWAIAANLKLYVRIKRQPLLTDERMAEIMQKCTHKIGIRKSIPVIMTNQINTPCLFGIFNPRLLLPNNLNVRLTEDDMKHIFLHELSHLKRKDILVNWLAIVANIVHWFNPVIWYAFRKMREDCELACDTNTLSLLSPEEYQSYGLSIINLLTSSRSPWYPGTTGFLGNKNNNHLKRRINLIKYFHRPTAKSTLAAVAMFMMLGFFSFIDITANGAAASQVNAETQTAPALQTSEAEANDYQKYLSFTPLLPSYTAGYQLELSQIFISEYDFLGKTIHAYQAAYGSHAAFTIQEALPNELHLANSGGLTKAQIQLGDLPATLALDKEGYGKIQFTKNNVEIMIGNIPGGGISLEELKKIGESIAVPLNTPPSSIEILKTGSTASEGIGFKTLQPDDIVVPPGYQLKSRQSDLSIKGSERTEVFSLYYTKGEQFINIMAIKGDQPYGFPDPVDIPETDCDLKQIENIKVKLRTTSNPNLPAALFSLPAEGLELRLYSPNPDLQEYDIEEVAKSVLQAYLK
jgi:beta-lactamase regulating signal transducer with metallopeptidase domain